jgi:hypothetical protein
LRDQSQPSETARNQLSQGGGVNAVSATFDFSHPSNLSVNHPVNPVTEGFNQYDG